MSAKRSDRQRGFVALRTLILFAAFLLAGCTQLKQCAYQGVDRDEWQKPEQVIRALSIRPGDHIADLGSGGGYFTFRLAKAVGPSGKVYAVDIDEGLNQALAKRAREEGYPHIEVILAKVDDPLLPESGVDLIFITNTYHHLQDRIGYFKNAKKYLRPGGRVAVVEFSDKAWLENIAGHATSPEVVKKEMAEAGYTLENEFDFLPRQSFLVFTGGR
jgi:arsenite methyltransferase